MTGAAEADADIFAVPGKYNYVMPYGDDFGIVVDGASGGNTFEFNGGLGAEIAGVLALTSGQHLTLYVGGMGANAVT
jgi:hypothetical protein